MKTIKFIGVTIICSFALFFAIVWGIICNPKGKFYTSYMNVINDKFDRLMEINDPKIIIVGGSNCAFGIDQDMIEEATGFKVVNLGLHAGFGHLFYTELAKQNINSGDIVLLAYEYNWIDEGAFSDLGVDVVMSGIDDNVAMYKYIPAKELPSILGYVFTYASKKREAKEQTGIYSREAFDPISTQLTMSINENLDFDPEINGTFSLTADISEDSKQYLVELRDYVQNKGASIYFVSPPLAKESIQCDYSEFEKLKMVEEKEIGIKYISTPSDYFFEDTFLYDTKYHCNTAGMKKRTELLIDDMKKSGIF